MTPAVCQACEKCTSAPPSSALLLISISIPTHFAYKSNTKIHRGSTADPRRRSLWPRGSVCKLAHECRKCNATSSRDHKLCPLVTTRGCISCRHNQSRERYLVGLKGPTGSICKGKLLQPIPEPGDAQCMLVADAVLTFKLMAFVRLFEPLPVSARLHHFSRRHH